jgi:hypothetical protein
MFEAGLFQLPEQYKQQLINFYASQGHLFTQNEVIIDNEYIDEQIDEEYDYTQNSSENEKCNHSATENIQNPTAETAINPKLANAILLITTLTIFHQIAKNNGFDIFDWISGKLSPKKNNDYFDGFY